MLFSEKSLRNKKFRYQVLPYYSYTNLFFCVLIILIDEYLLYALEKSVHLTHTFIPDSRVY